MYLFTKPIFFKSCFVLFIFLILAGNNNVHGQYGRNDTLLVNAVIYNGDTIEAKILPDIVFSSVFSRVNYEKRRVEWARLRNAVYATYSYAVRAGMVMNDINRNLANITQKSARKKYIRSREKELKKEFTDPLTNLSTYQGKILMKLIYRETGNNCYEIIKEYKGGLAARFYQTVAFFFGNSLKQSYNPQGEDAAIEKILQELLRAQRG